MDEKLYEIKPNLKKAFWSGVLRMIVIAGIILGLFYYLKSLGIFEVFLELSAEVGFEIPITTINIIVPVIAAMVVLIGALYAYLRWSQVRYVCYNDHLSLYKSFMIYQIREIQILYWNIKSVALDPKQAKCIKIEAGGLEKGFVKLEYLDNATEAVAAIQELIKRFKASYYADFYKQQKIDNIKEQL